METEIEELRETLYEAGELIEKLKVFSTSDKVQESNEILAKIKALLPEPEPFEAWGNFYREWAPCLYRTLERAKENAGTGATRTAVHLREVTPAPERERFTGMELRSLWDAGRSWDGFAEKINAEIERASGTEGES